MVPIDWARTSITVNGPHVQPDRVILNDLTLPFGYGYQWWLPKGDLGEFSAIGIYNQFVFVDPSRGVVIVTLSSNRAYGTTPLESTNHEIETIAFLRAIAQHCD